MLPTQRGEAAYKISLAKSPDMVAILNFSAQNPDSLISSGATMRKGHFVCAVFVALLAYWNLSFAETAKEFHDKGEAVFNANDHAKAVDYCS